MASILRSSKFVRYIAGFARNIVVNTPREFDGNFINQTQCFCGAIPRSFALHATTAQHDQNLDKSLRRLDQDVKKTGRISKRDIEDVLEEIRSTRSATSSQSLLVIRCCGNLVPEELPEIRTKLVQEIWNTLMKLNVPMDISHYNALLRVYLENEHPFSPTDFLSDLETKGIEPNRVTYQRLIARYCQVGDIEGATRILEFMKEKQLPVNENVFNALVNGHSQTGDMESARGILSVMQQAGLEPSADTYTTLLCGYAKLGNIESLNELLQEAESKELYLLDKDYLDIIYSLAINNHEIHIPLILSHIKKSIGYNYDAINVILRLINKNKEDAGLTILESMPRGNRNDGSLQPSGMFFIKQLVKANKPTETIIKVCNHLEKEKLNDNCLLYAAEASLELGNENLSYDLLSEMKKRGYEIRQHYFWPLLAAKAKSNSDKEIINVLMKMSEFNLTPSPDTIREYVIPNMKGKSSDIIAQLRQANISVASASCSLVQSLLLKNDIEEAAIIISRVSAYYYPELIKKPLTAAFYKTKNIDAYVRILRHVYENLSRKEVVASNVSFDQTEIVGFLLLDLLTSPRQFAEYAENILSKTVEQGLSISTSTAEKIEAKLGEKMTPEISTLLGKLSSGELIPIPIEKKQPSYIPSSQMNIPQLERLIHNLSAKNQDTKGLKRQLLTLYYREKELEKTELLLKDLENDNFVYTAGVYAQLLDIYAYHDKLDEAMTYYNKMCENESINELNKSKVIRLVGLLFKNDKFDEALDILEKCNSAARKDDQTYQYRGLCWRLLNSLAERGLDEQLNTVFNCLVKWNYIDVNNILLGPLIKVHLVRNDLDKALQTFEWCCNQFRATPWKNELACKLIQNEDADKLQKLTDLSTIVHGEINSLYDLVFAFVECGRIRQARKILETPGLQNKPHRINSACERYRMEGMVQPLEGLKDATKDLNHIDRNDIYYQLLLSYIKQNDTDKALGLWTQMQDEDMAPNDRFLSKLGQFLSENNLQVPFVIPEISVSNNVEPKSNISIFRQLLKNNDLNGALQIKNKSKEQIPNNELSLLIEKLVQANKVMEATEVTIDMLKKNNVPITRVFRYLLNKLANNGNVNALEKIGSIIDSNLKKLVSFDNKMCHANLVSGKSGDYLQKLEDDIDRAQEADLTTLAEKFPRGGAIGILEKHPELLDKYSEIAVKYAKKDILAPINVLWSHHFINNRHEEAENLWKTYLHGAPRIMFQRVVQHCRETKDDLLTKKLIDHLKISKVTEGAIGNAYSCLLDVLVNNEKHEEVIQCFEQAVKDVNIESINRTAILRAKDIYDKLNVPFKHQIPAKVNKGTSSQSSSSSDEEIKSNQN